MKVTNLDLTLLRTFVAVAEGDSFARAAQSVFKSQAAISQQMQRLELQLGCDLFIKSGRSKRLTDQGVRLLEYARPLLRMNDEACMAMEQGVFDTQVKIGACADAIDTLLPEYLALSKSTYPNLNIEIKVGRSRWLASALRRGEIDLMLDVEEHTEFNCDILRTSPVVWISGARTYHENNVVLPLVLIDSPCVFRRIALDALDAESRAWRPSFQTTTVASLRAALRAGLGITARTIEMLTPGLKVVDKEMGLPGLPSISYRLYTRNGDDSKGTRKLAELFSAR